MKALSFDIAFEPVRARQIAMSEVSPPTNPFLTQAELNYVVDACNQWQPVTEQSAEQPMGTRFAAAK
jgi:hypothetical protein